jgi:heptose III glucuronosyltransferase
VNGDRSAVAYNFALIAIPDCINHMSQHPPLLSIVTPAYNAAQFLSPLIEALALAAAHCALEWIVIDDGSTDNTAQLAETLTPPHIVKHLIRQDNVGLAESRNRGLAASTGEYVWFVDADDLIVPDALLKLIDAIKLQPDMLGFQAVRFGEGVADEPVYMQPKPSHQHKGEDWLEARISEKEWRHFAWLYLYRRQFLVATQLQFRRGILHEDIAFTTKAALQANIICYVDVCAYRYRLNPTSLTGSHNPARIFERINSYFIIVEQLREINRSMPMRAKTKALLKGEVIGQALQIFEVAKLLNAPEQYTRVINDCRERRFAESLFQEVANFKRLRQVIRMWFTQAGVIRLK